MTPEQKTAILARLEKAADWIDRLATPERPAPSAWSEVDWLNYWRDQRRETANAIREATAALDQCEQERDAWKDAIIDAAVVDWIYTAEHDTNPRKAINDLLCWQVKLALDPAVSEDAAKLHQRAEAAEASLAQLRKEFTTLSYVCHDQADALGKLHAAQGRLKEVLQDIIDEENGANEMRKTARAALSTLTEDLRPEYELDYTRAKPNRFKEKEKDATEEQKE